MKIKKPLISQGFSRLMYGDPDWVRTSDPHPVKMILNDSLYIKPLQSALFYAVF
jgi:hypothetical protein